MLFSIVVSLMSLQVSQGEEAPRALVALERLDAGVSPLVGQQLAFGTERLGTLFAVIAGRRGFIRVRDEMNLQVALLGKGFLAPITVPGGGGAVDQPGAAVAILTPLQARRVGVLPISP